MPVGSDAGSDNTEDLLDCLNPLLEESEQLRTISNQLIKKCQPSSVADMNRMQNQSYQDFALLSSPSHYDSNQYNFSNTQSSSYNARSAESTASSLNTKTAGFSSFSSTLPQTNSVNAMSKPVSQLESKYLPSNIMRNSNPSLENSRPLSAVLEKMNFSSGFVAPHSLLSSDAPVSSAICSNANNLTATKHQNSLQNEHLESLKRENWTLSQLIENERANSKSLEQKLRDTEKTLANNQMELRAAQNECTKRSNEIHQLDATLNQLASSWKTRDLQRDETINSLRNEIEQSNSKAFNAEQLLGDLQNKLSASDAKNKELDERLITVKQANAEQIRVLSAERDQLGQTIMQDKRNLEQIKFELRDCRVKMEQFDSELTQKQNFIVELKKQVDSGRKQFAEQKAEMEQKFTEDFNTEKQNLYRAYEKKLEDARQQFEKSMQTKLQHAEQTRLSNLKEMEHNFKEIEIELQNRMERQIKNAEQSHSEARREEIRQLTRKHQDEQRSNSERHQNELEHLGKVARQEMAKRLAELEETIGKLRQRLEQSEASIQFWRNEKEQIENQRSHLAAQLCEIMQLKCKEVLDSSVLAGSNGNAGDVNHAGGGGEHDEYDENASENSISLNQPKLTGNHQFQENNRAHHRVMTATSPLSLSSAQPDITTPTTRALNGRDSASTTLKSFNQRAPNSARSASQTSKQSQQLLQPQLIKAWKDEPTLIGLSPSDARKVHDSNNSGEQLQLPNVAKLNQISLI